MWTQEELDRAIHLVKVEKMPIRRAARENNVHESMTLCDRLATGNFKKCPLGQPSYLGEVAERKLVEHIRKLQAAGFAPTRNNLKKIAYNLAQYMGLKEKLNNKKITGKNWYKSFMRKNPDLTVRKAEDISNVRANGMMMVEVDSYFDLLTKTMTEHQLLHKPGNIFNMDESGLQLNNDPDHVIAVKGSKDVHVRK